MTRTWVAQWPQRVRALWPRLRQVPVVGDYLDGRARPKQPSGPISQLTVGVILGALGWLTQARNTLAGFLGELGGYLTWLLIPGALVALCLYAVCARSAPAPLGQRYEYVQPLRQVAKLVAIVAAVVLVLRIIEARPLGGRPTVSGYLCDDKGVPVTEASLSLIDAAQRQVSEVDGPDRAGYFSLTATGWAPRPVRFQLTAPGCPAVVRPARGETVAAGCPGAVGLAREDSRSRRLAVWTVPRCPP